MRLQRVISNEFLMKVISRQNIVLESKRSIHTDFIRTNGDLKSEF